MVRALRREGLSKEKVILGAKMEGVRACSVLNSDRRVEGGKWILTNGCIITGHRTVSDMFYTLFVTADLVLATLTTLSRICPHRTVGLVPVQATFRH
jgi:hypothetical protein